MNKEIKEILEKYIEPVDLISIENEADPLIEELTTFITEECAKLVDYKINKKKFILENNKYLPKDFIKRVIENIEELELLANAIRNLRNKK